MYGFIYDRFLCHYGVPGMKWGVRRYQNEDGSLTAAGEKRYGQDSNEYVSARKITRDYNNLDKGYANAAARASRVSYIGQKLSGKAIKKGKTPNDIVTGTDRLSRKMRSVAQKQAKAVKDMHSIEQMQYRVLAKAAKQGLTVTSKPVQRYGTTGGDFVAQLLGGPLANIAYQVATKGSGHTVVSGSKIKASTKGDGSITVYNMQAGKDYDEKRKRG